jgi:hypothetical protein
VARSLDIKEVRREIRGLIMDLNSFIKFERALFLMIGSGFVGVLCAVSLLETFA